MNAVQTDLVEKCMSLIRDKLFPCIAAKAAYASDAIRCFVARHMACPADDRSIIRFLYEFVDHYRKSSEGFMSAIVIFEGPVVQLEDQFEDLLWKRLQAFADIDAKSYGYDARVSPDPGSPNFSFSLKEEAFYVIGLHPGSSRAARAFPVPALVFNPHAQFARLRLSGKFGPMRSSVRKRDEVYSGSVNPMLSDFGESSEAIQYSGKTNNTNWKCPFSPPHGKSDHHPSP